MDPASSITAPGEEMGMSEGAPTSAREMQNGHCGTALDQGASSPTEETGGQVTGRAGSSHRVMPQMVSEGTPVTFDDPDDRRPVSVQAHADTEELLSRAHAHAELLRVHAEAARAEAESVRAEAAALRRAARDEAAAARSRARGLTAHVRATAEECCSAIEGQADTVSAEMERLRTEAVSLRRLLQAEIDAGLAETQRMRAEIQGLRAETDKLAAELRLLSAHAGVAAAREKLAVETTRGEGAGRLAHQPEGGDYAGAICQDEHAATTVAGDRPGDGRLDELRRAMAIEVRQRLAKAYAEAGGRLSSAEAEPGPIGGGREARWLEAAEEGAAATSPARLTQVPVVETHAGPVFPQLNVGELLRDIWDAVYTESTRVSERDFPGGPAKWAGDDSPNGAGEPPSVEHPVGGHRDRPRASEPLIGSGGWRATRVPTSPAPPVDDPVDAEAASPPPGAARHGRRFRRPG